MISDYARTVHNADRNGGWRAGGSLRAVNTAEYPRPGASTTGRFLHSRGLIVPIRMSEQSKVSLYSAIDAYKVFDEVKPYMSAKARRKVHSCGWWNYIRNHGCSGKYPSFLQTDKFRYPCPPASRGKQYRNTSCLERSLLYMYIAICIFRSPHT